MPASERARRVNGAVIAQQLCCVIPGLSVWTCGFALGLHTGKASTAESGYMGWTSIRARICATTHEQQDDR